ncbi:MAG: type II toxin-antitoxin system VapC family toxin [Lautropia sp.]
MIHLDTSFLIRALVRGSTADAMLRTWIIEDESIVMSALAWGEFLCGPLDPELAMASSAIVGTPIPLTARHAERGATIFNQTGRKRGTFADCLIAAVAIVEGGSLATGNRRDFESIPGLMLAT